MTFYIKVLSFQQSQESQAEYFKGSSAASQYFTQVSAASFDKSIEVSKYQRFKVSQYFTHFTQVGAASILIKSIKVSQYQSISVHLHLIKVSKYDSIGQPTVFHLGQYGFSSSKYRSIFIWEKFHFSHRCCICQ